MDNKLKVIVTGAQGQLGVDMVKCLRAAGYETYGLGRQELDITDMEQVQSVFGQLKPDIAIHAAAYTKVDLAESEQDEAFRINAYGTRNVAVAAEQLKAKLVYISTDYVFDGEGSQPYHEFHTTNPINVYGHSKRAGEQFVQYLHSRYFIVRTSWVYGKNGSNFVKTMLKLAEAKKVISVVSDQRGCPTYTIDLAACISQIMLSCKYGVYHVSNSGDCSWYEFAKAIFEISGTDTEVIPVSAESFPRPAKRPAYSVLDRMALAMNGFDEIRHWRAALEHFLKTFI